MTAIDLVFPKNDSLYDDVANGYSTLPPPSGLSILSAYVKKQHPDIDINIYDGFVPNTPQYSPQGTPIVGFSDWFNNHQTVITSAKEIKQQFPQTSIVLGGPNAGHLGSQILANHPYIDYVVQGDGEEALTALIDVIAGKRDISTAPNIFYREGNTIAFTFPQSHNIRINPLFDFSQLVHHNLDVYDDTTEAAIYSNRTPIPLSSIRGCMKAMLTERCGYCSLTSQKVRLMSPEKFWEQIGLLQEQYGISSFFETGDDFVIGRYPEQLLQAKPDNLDVTLRIYSYPDVITASKAKVLHNVGVNEIFLGVETIVPEILENMGKQYDPKKIPVAIQALADEGINVFLPFLFGFPGETIDTAQRNHEFAYEMVAKHSNISRILYSLAVPVVGSRWFNELSQDAWIQEQYPGLATTDNIDYAHLTSLSIEQRCTISQKELLEIVNNPPNLANDNIASFGGIHQQLKKN